MKVIAVSNQKGGTGKTVTSWNISAALTELKKNVLLIDFDPQSHLTTCHAIDLMSLDNGMYEVLMGMTNINKAILDIGKYGFIPTKNNLSGAEVDLTKKVGSERYLSKRLQQLNKKYDYVVIDCPPNLSHLTFNALFASDIVIIPVQCEFLAYNGIKLLKEKAIDEINDIKEHPINCLILPTMYDSRTNQSKDVFEQMKDDNIYPVWSQPIKRSVKFSDSTIAGKDIFDFFQGSEQAESYLEVAKLICKL